MRTKGSIHWSGCWIYVLLRMRIRDFYLRSFWQDFYGLSKYCRDMRKWTRSTLLVHLHIYWDWCEDSHCPQQHIKWVIELEDGHFLHLKYKLWVISFTLKIFPCVLDVFAYTVLCLDVKNWNEACLPDGVPLVKLFQRQSLRKDGEPWGVYSQKRWLWFLYFHF